MGMKYKLFERSPFKSEENIELKGNGEKFSFNEVMNQRRFLDAVLIRRGNNLSGKVDFSLFDSHDEELVRSEAKNKVEIEKKKHGLSIKGDIYTHNFISEFDGEIELYYLIGTSGWGTIVNALSGKGFGVSDTAKDGHACDSAAEIKIDDFMHEHGIAHKREPQYPSHPEYNPNGMKKADWLINGEIFVEYWGMEGTKIGNYEENMAKKKKLAKENNIPLINFQTTAKGKLVEKLKEFL